MRVPCVTHSLTGGLTAGCSLAKLVELGDDDLYCGSWGAVADPREVRRPFSWPRVVAERCSDSPRHCQGQCSHRLYGERLYLRSTLVGLLSSSLHLCYLSCRFNLGYESNLFLQPLPMSTGLPLVEFVRIPILQARCSVHIHT